MYDSGTYRVTVPTYVPVDYLHLSLRYYPYVRRRAIYQVTSLAHNWRNQLLGATVGVDLVPLRDEEQGLEIREEDDYNHSSYTVGYYQV